MSKFKTTKVKYKNENSSKKSVFNNRAKNIGLYKQTLIKSMPDFIPGRQNGKIVRTYYTLPFHIKTQE